MTAIICFATAIENVFLASVSNVSLLIVLPRQWESMINNSMKFALAGTEPFGFPITTFFGTRDRRIKEDMVRGWQRFTKGEFECLAIEGHHLWPLAKESKVVWLDAIAERLMKL